VADLTRLEAEPYGQLADFTHEASRTPLDID
jgi:hypothetical protein